MRYERLFRLGSRRVQRDVSGTPMYNIFAARYVQMFAVRIRGYSHDGPPSTINIVHNIPLCGDKKKCIT